MDYTYKQDDELSEGQALLFWDSWIEEHPEHEEIIDEQLSVIEQNFKKLKRLTSLSDKPASFGRGQAAIILYRVVEKGYLPKE